jgi:NADPH:quinone reductase-like Zn-dependent oxidoreductase
MKAITSRSYGSPSVLNLEDIEKPTPKDNEILVKIIASAVSSGDARIRALNVPFGFKFITRLMFGFKKPKQPVLGVVFSGIVESIGKDVEEFKIGDEVFGASSNFGCHAEYVAIPESGAINFKPKNLSVEEAAAMPFGGLTSLKYLRDFGKLKSGEKILIVGASGDLGVLGVQLAKYYGAEVTGVCSTPNLELVRSLGADNVIDYTTSNFTENGEVYDMIYDTIGVTKFSECKNSLAKNGRLLLAAAGMPQYLQVLTTSMSGGKKVVAGVAMFNKQDLKALTDLIESEKIKPVIVKRFPLANTAEAHTYVDSGRKVGSAIINIG